jgi:hypothetical protein
MQLFVPKDGRNIFWSIEFGLSQSQNKNSGVTKDHFGAST